MPTKADADRLLKLRAIVYQASDEGWSNERLDEELVKLYRARRASKSKG